MSQMGKIIADYLTTHGDLGAFVGDVTDDDGNIRPHVLRFDGVIDTEDLVRHISAAVTTKAKALEDEDRRLQLEAELRHAERNLAEAQGRDRLARESAELSVREARENLANFNKELGN